MFAVTPAVIAATVVGALLAALLGTAAIRISGEFLRIASFGVQEILSTTFSNWLSVTGGVNGIVLVAPSASWERRPTATSGDILLATREDFYMATDRQRLSVPACVMAMLGPDVADKGVGGLLALPDMARCSRRAPRVHRKDPGTASTAEAHGLPASQPRSLQDAG